jgi:DNA-binding NtrC family response regulator
MQAPTILIADDEGGIRLMLRTTLASDGYQVLEASNGREALDQIRASHPDLLVLDLNMPVMDGMALLEQLKKVDPRPRVIVLTAYGSVSAAVKATRLGALDFLEKPITPADLRQAVKSVLNEPELDAPSNADVNTAGGYEEVLGYIRHALKREDLASAESLLEVAAERRNKQAAEYFNLLGVLYEVQRKWRLARKCYGRAISSDGQFEPSQANMRRLYELHTYGKSSLPILLSDGTAAKEGASR